MVTSIGDHIKQLLDTLASYRRDNPELGKMSADRVDHGGLLADKQMARAMKHQTTLLLGRLGRGKTAGQTGASVVGGSPLDHRHQRREPGTLTWRCRDRLS